MTTVMSAPHKLVVDGNEAAARIAYRASEVIAIYPITPASPMGEHADVWAAEGRPNLWGDVPSVVEMQSEGGAAGAVHGALQTGALTTTFTASQGLLLMIPNLYKIAGEQTACCLHVAARTLATHALSIFGDHSDVMACRATGMALLCSGSVQEAQDFAAIGHAATLRARVPFLHFFDGFRTSHEIQKIDALADADLEALLDPGSIAAHRARALDPEHPVLRGSAQNPDVFFQAREAGNPFTDACPGHVRAVMELFARRTGRRYDLFEYFGHPEAERVIVLMGSGAEVAHEAVDHLVGHGERVGLVKVRLYRPFDVHAFVAALPHAVRSIAVLDRTKEPGAPAEPLFLDVVAALEEVHAAGRLPFAARPLVIGGRYGLASKEFDLEMVRAVFAELDAPAPRRRFTVGIVDDVTHLSLAVDRTDRIEEPAGTYRAVFYGLGSDGTVSANKNSIQILGQDPERHVQAYFVYDSKKAGAMTVSHLRFGGRPIRSSYLVGEGGAQFVACHQFAFVERQDVLRLAAPRGTFLLNSPFGPEEVWQRLPREAQQDILDKELRFFVLDAYRVAQEAGLGRRINTVMQTAFFALTDLLPRAEAAARIRAGVEKTYGKAGTEVVERNARAIDAALDHLHEVAVPRAVSARHPRPPLVPAEAPEFVQRVTALLLAGRGDHLPVSAFPPDGTWPTGTSRWEKRGIAPSIPIWDPAICIQCNLCALVCPHAAIRAKVYPEPALSGAPDGFRSSPAKLAGFQEERLTIQVAPEDCTGCSLCVEVCPAKDRTNPRHKAIDMQPLGEHLERERASYRFFLDLPEVDRARVAPDDVKASQLLQPLFEYSGACAGCGETPYLKLLTQLFGDRLLVANATGCSSIYGGNLPTTPYATRADGRGPAWSNSLFEDNAEFGLGFRLALDARRTRAWTRLAPFAERLGQDLVAELRALDAKSEAGVARARELVAELGARLARSDDPRAGELAACLGDLVHRSVWLVGGDGWAYDIGYGGLDHVLASDRDVNVLVLDTEVYSNTGGQQSKATPIGASAKFASAGKEIPKKDLGLEMASYGTAYVARVAFGAKPRQALEALREAESYDGPSLVLAYSPCIAHGYDLRFGVEQQKRAVASGYWPLWRYDPRRARRGEPPLVLDSGEPRMPLKEFLHQEARFRVVERADPERFRRLQQAAQRQASERFAVYRQLAGITVAGAAGEDAP